MPLFTRLTALCEVITKHATLPVSISRPNETPGLYIWPWRIEEDTRVRSTPLPRSADNDPLISAPAPAIHFLVLSSTNLDGETISALESARRSLLETPVFEVGNGKVSVMPATLSTSELTDLFTAAAIPLRLCLAYTLRSTV
jgi:hypothetical protein